MSMSWPSKADVGGLFQLDLNYHVTFRRSLWGFVLGTNQSVLVHRLLSCFVMLHASSGIEGTLAWGYGQ
jgi:hypothetical protein